MNQTTYIRFIKKQLFTLLFCLLAATTAQAQNTVRKIQVPLGNEGAQLFGYLPEKPTGRAVICCPGGATKVWPSTTKVINGRPSSTHAALPSLCLNTACRAPIISFR